MSGYEVMQRLHTHRGRNFESAVFKEIIDILGMKRTQTTPYHPQSDGLVE
jgi:transposase InsO family protein